MPDKIKTLLQFIPHGNLDATEQDLRKSLSHDPTSSQSWHLLGLLLHQKGDQREGDQCLAKAEQTDAFNPLLAQAQSAAQNSTQQGMQEQSWKICSHIIAQQKNHPRALYIMAMIASERGALEQAAGYLRQGLSDSPYNQSLWQLLSQINSQLRLYPQAIEASKKLTERQSDSAKAWLLHADNLLNSARYDDALRAFEQALKHTESHQAKLTITLQQAHIYKIQGNSALCIVAYSQCLAAKHTIGSAAWALANLSVYEFNEQTIKQLEAARHNIALAPEQRCQVNFSMAKINEQQGDYQAAITAYHQANNTRNNKAFNPARHQQTCKALMNTFSEKLFSKNSPGKTSHTTPQPTPIFIVGMPRSGSTLAEQMLATHSHIEGTEELKILPTIAKQIYQHSCKKNGNNSGNMSGFSQQELAQYGQAYLAQSQIFRTKKAFFIDKLPANFQHVGLIALILPQAVIIDLRRQPLACGFGVYKQYFGQGFDFSYSLSDIGFYYNQYLSIMDHWNKVLPGKVLCIAYEALVLDTKAQIKALLSHCGLSYEAVCLQFHQNQRPVKTASADQVRQPLNTKGLELFRHYESHLQPLKDALGEQTLKRFGL
ncbi:MAG: tetratricopeptide (TPR) repeat protein [Alteromonadaceae bacterium]|jgi:tetratricopeptide (TPR) repeat protein